MVAFDGKIVVVRFRYSFLYIFADEWLKLIEVIGIITLTTHEALRFVPSVVVAVIVAEPTDFAVTFPFWSTVATLVLLDFHERVLFVAFVGKTVATRFNVLFLNMVADVWFKLMEVTGCVTVTTHEALRCVPSVVVAVIVVVPTFFAVTFPF